MLEIRKLTISTIKDRKIIENLSITVNQKDRLAIIGEEGNGKSTLLKCIYDKKMIESYTAITGDIIKSRLKIGYLEQFLNEAWKIIPVQEYFLKETPYEEIDHEKYQECYRVEKIMKEIGLDVQYLKTDKKIGTLSGGEKVKLQIAKLLIGDPDILLLDEPTNDLDIDTLQWLEKFLLALKIPVIFISHDEVLLERVANGILHLEQTENKTKLRYTYEQIGYREYVEKRNYLIQKQEQVATNEKREYEKQTEKYQRMYQQVASDLQSVSRQEPSKARLLKKKMKSVKTVGKKLEDTELSKRPQVEEAIFAKFHQEDTIYANKVVVDFKEELLKNGEKELSRNIKLKIVGKEKIGIIGKNGSGKTTLLKKIQDNLKDRTDIVIGYMPQNYEDILPKEISPISYLKEEAGKEQETMARTYMGSMKFTVEEMTNTIEELSGGQKAKLLLIKLIMQQSNVLILDEPTRNLSPLSIPVIIQLLKEFKGAIISVSHDRKYISEVCDIVYVLEKEGLQKRAEEIQ